MTDAHSRSFSGTWRNDASAKTGNIHVSFKYHEHRGLTDVTLDGKNGTGTCMAFGDSWAVSLFVEGYWYALKWNGTKVDGEYGVTNEQRRGTVEMTQI